MRSHEATASPKGSQGIYIISAKRKPRHLVGFPGVNQTMDGSLISDWKILFYAAVGIFSTQNAFQRSFLGAENDVIFVLREFAMHVLGWLPRGFGSGLEQ